LKFEGSKSIGKRSLKMAVNESKKVDPRFWERWRSSGAVDLPKKEFSLGDILSVTTERLLSPDGISGFYGVQYFLVETYKLPMITAKCREYLLRCFPELAKAGTPENLAKLDQLICDAKFHEGETAETAVKMWLDWMVEPGQCNLQKKYKLRPIPHKKHLHKHPISELMG
jgi:hypothetical protein